MLEEFDLAQTLLRRRFALVWPAQVFTFFGHYFVTGLRFLDHFLLLGHCERNGKKVNPQSPLEIRQKSHDEPFCGELINPGTLGLGLNIFSMNAHTVRVSAHYSDSLIALLRGKMVFARLVE